MKSLGLIAAVAVAAMAAPALAQSSALVLVLGGEAYDGPPEFAVTFDGKPLGAGAVEAAIDTEALGRLADVADKSPYVQSFEFPIPDAMFDPNGEIGIRLTNEAYGGEGSNRDRNLYLVSASVNGRVVLPSGFTTDTADGVEPNAMLGDLLALYDNNAEGVAAAPQGGWPEPDASLQTVSFEPDAIASTGSINTPAETTGPLILEPRADAQVAKAAPEVMPQSTAEAADGETIEVAALGSERYLSSPRCGLDQLYNVVGFNENSNDLTPRLMRRLDQIAADIGRETCTVQITGYSSTKGDYATNALFAIERAQNVLAYLREKGLKFEAVNATGAGETAKFGETLGSNRRVVITVMP